jgi:hypothetical protein
MGHIRRAGADAEPRSEGEDESELHALSHHGSLLSDPRGAADRSQPPFRGHRRQGDGVLKSPDSLNDTHRYVENIAAWLAGRA